VTSSLRLPDFVVAGVPRAGTSALGAQLRKLDDVHLPATKELHYFTAHHRRGLGWYADQFRDARDDQRCGELTPAYVLHEHAVRRMARTLPDAVVVVVLRDPIDRAYSHFWLNQAKGTERLSFEEALAAEPARLRRDPTDLSHGYLTSGEYSRLLRQLFEHVPREQVHVVMFDDWVREPDATLAALCARLGLAAPSAPVTSERTNHRGPVRSVRLSALARRLPGPAVRTVRRWNTTSADYPELRPTTRARLEERFAPDREGLSALLGREVPWGPAVPR
jgi:hypothetical protein